MPGFNIAVSLYVVASLQLSVLADNGVQVNTSNSNDNIVGDAANEPTLKVSPVNPEIMVIGWRQFPSQKSDSRFAGVAWSNDGGNTWTNGGQLDAPPNRPKDAEQSDPLLAVDADGVFYYWSEVFRPGPTTHYVYKSFDGGQTWDIPAQVQEPPSPGDKEWMVIDRTGGMGHGLIHGGWNNFDLGGYSFVRSIDQGQTWSEPVRMSDNDGSQWMMHMAVGPDGEVYAAWRNYRDNAIYITKSTSAQDPNATPIFDAFGTGGNFGIDLIVDDSNDPGFLEINPVGFHQIYLQVDQSKGASRGNVYCLWADGRNGDSDIYFAQSTDGGFNWQTGIRVNDDKIGNDVIQWMPSMSVAPNGRIDALWYDTRDANIESSIYYSFSTDAGITWSPNKRISESFDTTLGWPVQEKIGDYVQSVSDNTGVNLAYAATFNGEQDIYFVRVRPGTTATITDVQIIRGNLLDGGINELTDSDDEYFHTRSGFGETLADLHIMDMLVTSETTVDSPTAIDVAIESHIDEPVGTASIFLHNWNTDNFDQVGQYSIGATDEIFTVEGLDATDYVNNSGIIETSIKHIVFVPFLAFTFESFIDQVKIRVQ